MVIWETLPAKCTLVPFGSDGRPGGVPKPVHTPFKEELGSPVWTADMKELLVIVGSGNSGVARVRIDGTRDPERIAGLSQAADVTLSRDGTKLAFPRGGGDDDLWRIDLKHPEQSGVIARSTFTDSHGAYSGDGRQIAFGSNRTGSHEIWVADAAGQNARPLTTFGGPVPGSPAWSPDDKQIAQIAFDGTPHGNPDIFVVPSIGGRTRRLTTWPRETRGRHGPTMGSRLLSLPIALVVASCGEFGKRCQTDVKQITKEGGMRPVPLRTGSGLYIAVYSPRPKSTASILTARATECLCGRRSRISLYGLTRGGLWFACRRPQRVRIGPSWSNGSAPARLGRLRS